MKTEELPYGLWTSARLVSVGLFFAILTLPLTALNGDRILDFDSIRIVELVLSVLVVCAAEWILTPNAYVSLLEGTGMDEVEAKKYAHNEVYLWWNVYAFALNFMILWQSGWWYGSDWIFDERWPEIPCPPLALLLIYLEIGHYLYGFASIILLPPEQRKTDHLRMTFHHLVAASLLLSSAGTNFWKFAVVVLFLHDGCDIFLAGAKKANYDDMKTVKVAMFVGLVTTWPLLRLAWFGKLLYSAVFLPPGWDDKLAKVYEHASVMHPFFVVALALLMVLNVLWYIQIVKIAISGDLKDTREKGG